MSVGCMLLASRICTFHLKVTTNDNTKKWMISVISFRDLSTVITYCPTGMYFLIYPLGWMNDEKMVVHCLKSGCIEFSISSNLEISLGPQDIPWVSPSGNFSGLALGNLLVVGDVQPNTSRLKAVYGYNPSQVEI